MEKYWEHCVACMRCSVSDACSLSREYAGSVSTIALPVVLTRRSLPMLGRSSSRRMMWRISRGSRVNKSEGLGLRFDRLFGGALYGFFTGLKKYARSNERTSRFGSLHRNAVPEDMPCRKGCNAAGEWNNDIDVCHEGAATLRWASHDGVCNQRNSHHLT